MFPYSSWLVVICAQQPISSLAASAPYLVALCSLWRSHGAGHVTGRSGEAATGPKFQWLDDHCVGKMRHLTNIPTGSKWDVWNVLPVEHWCQKKEASMDTLFVVNNSIVDPWSWHILTSRMVSNSELGSSTHPQRATHTPSDQKWQWKIPHLAHLPSGYD